MKEFIKKHKTIAFGIFIISAIALTFLLFPTKPDRIEYAVVNPENGDIAFCYLDTTGEDALKISVFDKWGNELYTKVFPSQKYPDMIFDGEDLCVVLFDSYQILSYDREGNATDNTENNTSLNEIKQNDSFSQWKYSFWKNTYTCKINGTTYIYEAPLFYRRKATLTLINGDTEAVIYESADE